MNKFLMIFTFLASMVLSLPTHAQDTTDIDYTKLESIGLLHNEDSNSLGAGLYSQSNRSETVFLLKNINRTSWISLQNTVKNLLITSADSAAINNDIDIKEGHDLLTLRITALLRMGYNKEAFELYTKTSDLSLNEPLIRAGIFSMLLNKQKALACLEIKTSLDKYRNIDFWKELNAYCTLSLSKDSLPEYQTIIDQSENKILKSILENKDFRFEYDIKSFAALSFLERAILTAEDRIILPRSSNVPFQHIHPQHTAALLQQTHISEDTKALLSLNAVENGVQSIEFLSALYENILDKYKHNPPKGNDWYQLAVLYDETKAGWIPKKRKDKIAEAFTIADKYNDITLLPFLPAIQSMDIGEDLSLSHAVRATKLFLYSDDSPPEDWLEQLTDAKYENQSAEKMRLQLITALSLMVKTKDAELQEKAQKSLKTYLASDQKTAALKNIIENIDSTQNNGDKVRYIDTNGFDLVWNNRYTMPPYVILKALDQSSKNQDISVSLLLSAYTLSKIGNEDVYAGILGDIVIALDDLGFKQLSHRIIAQAILKIEN